MVTGITSRSPLAPYPPHEQCAVRDSSPQTTVGHFARPEPCRGQLIDRIRNLLERGNRVEDLPNLCRYKQSTIDKAVAEIEAENVVW